jgi:hypothetical protein
MSNFTQAHVYNSSFADVKTEFLEFCKSQDGYSQQDCDAAAVLINEANSNQLKRAGMLCKLVKRCSNTAYGDGCALGPLKTVTGAVANTSTGIVNLCTVEGTAAGYDVPGTNSKPLPKGKPEGTCTITTVASDCDVATQECSVATVRPFTSCSSSSGVETTAQLGMCVLKPEAACGKCLSDFAAWVADSVTQAAATSATQLAQDFYTECRVQNRSLSVCASAQNAIAASFMGNQGRRAGAICQLLGECRPDALEGKTMSTPASGTFSRCTKSGLHTGIPVTLTGALAGTPAAFPLALVPLGAGPPKECR